MVLSSEGQIVKRGRPLVRKINRRVFNRVPIVGYLKN